MCGMIQATGELNDRVQAGRVHNSLDRTDGFRSRERYKPSGLAAVEGGVWGRPGHGPVAADGSSGS
jgi:hypothetical protein